MVLSVAVVLIWIRIIICICSCHRRHERGEPDFETPEEGHPHPALFGPEVFGVVPPHLVPKPRVLETEGSERFLSGYEFGYVFHLVDSVVGDFVGLAAVVAVSHILQEV